MRANKTLAIVFLVVCSCFFLRVNNGVCRVAMEVYTATGTVAEVTSAGKLLLADGAEYYPAPKREVLVLGINPGTRVNIRYYVRENTNVYLEITKGSEKLPERIPPASHEQFSEGAETWK